MNQSIYNRIRYGAIAALAITTGVIGYAHATSNDARQGQARVTAQQGDQTPELGIEEILQRLKAAGYSGFREVEREWGRYEVKGQNAKGEWVELYVDARTAEVIREERDD